ncbi:DUF2726 domain-containing protein [Thiomicrorhabdus sp. 6S3-12]|uniref:DUF2726 domain-containing protein n=1 Tax=Thiomicrorhabdus sp. 6S3-12 TaxID=2819681 RepID=UPI001AACC9B3|nr:DUF2726 domain-containing protein [Thiomicrorhabdus sp. 6S3-12]MBO1923473.1 DUF2726 domain-containing protein [Thiomicrorhabdus sp. 6S3-12]
MRLSTSYKQKKQLLNGNENKLYQQLKEIGGTDMHVMPKQSLDHLIEPNINQWERNSGWESLQAQIREHVIDFVICDKEWNIICAIAYIDSNKNERVDPVVIKSLDSASVPLITLYSHKNYTSKELADFIAHEVQRIL